MLRKMVVAVLQITAACSVVGSGSGCSDRNDRDHDPVIAELERVVKDPDTQDHVELAISIRRNDIVDTQPVLIAASVSYSQVYKKDILYVMVYDEDKDITGIGVREKRGSADREESVLVEEYPVFTHYPSDGTLQYRSLPIQLRRSNQRKNDQQWQDYVEARGFGKDFITTRTRFLETLPPVYVSVPEPNYLDVFVYAYDQAGHKSDAVKLHTRRLSPEPP